MYFGWSCFFYLFLLCLICLVIFILLRLLLSFPSVNQVNSTSKGKILLLCLISSLGISTHLLFIHSYPVYTYGCGSISFLLNPSNWFKYHSISWNNACKHINMTSLYRTWRDCKILLIWFILLYLFRWYYSKVGDNFAFSRKIQLLCAY